MVENRVKCRLTMMTGHVSSIDELFGYNGTHKTNNLKQRFMCGMFYKFEFKDTIYKEKEEQN